MRIAVLMTCHDRRAVTMRCLEALGRSEGLEGVGLTAFLVDDGSTDGTREAAAAFPWVRVIEGDGSLFWCRGTHEAFRAAQGGGFDHYLWLNDDTVLEPDAVARLLACEASIRARTSRPAIVVGTTVDRTRGAPTYGGQRRVSRWRPFSFRLVTPGDEPLSSDTMNGNVVLVPAPVAEAVGNLDPRFEHGMGDLDYGLRARARGVEVWVAPGVHGDCRYNSLEGTHLDTRLPFRERWRRMRGRKGLPWRSWLVLTSRHGGPLWPVFFLAPYLKFLVRGALGR